MWTTNGSLGLPSRRPEATRLAHVRGKATSVMLARIPSNEYQIRDEQEVEIKFDHYVDIEEHHPKSVLLSLLLPIVLVFASYSVVSWKLEAKPPFIKRYLSPG